jgi:hypothetical protein
MKKSLITLSVLAIFSIGAHAETLTQAEMDIEAQRQDDRMAAMQAEQDESTHIVGFRWIGMSLGTNNQTITPSSKNLFGTAVPSNSGFFGNASPAPYTQTQPNLSLNYTDGIVFSQYQNAVTKKTTFGGAVDANLLALNGHLIPLFKLDGMVMSPNESLIFMPNVGYSVRTGSAVGLDVLRPLCNSQNDCSISLKVGITKFNKSVEGATFVANVGVVKAF